MKRFKWKKWFNELLIAFSLINVLIGCNAIALDYVKTATVTTINSLFCLVMMVWGNPQIRFWESK